MPRIINNRKRLEIRRDLRKKLTKQELILWNEIRNNKIGCKFKRQVSFGPYFVDFYCKEKNYCNNNYYFSPFTTPLAYLRYALPLSWKGEGRKSSYIVCICICCFLVLPLSLPGEGQVQF